jgi:hypothetical protein
MKHLHNGFWLTWRSIFRKLTLKEGIPRKKAYCMIAEKYNVTPKMVSSYVGLLTQGEEKTHSRIYKQGYRKRIEKGYFRSYDYRYKNIIRHVDNLLPQVFNSIPELSLKAISNGIDNLSGISLKERTLEKLVGKYEGLPRGPPIVKTESGNYRLNGSFYRSQN